MVDIDTRDRMTTSDATPAQVPELTADIVFARLEELRAVLRLTEYLRRLRPVATTPSPPRR